MRPQKIRFLAKRMQMYAYLVGTPVFGCAKHVCIRIITLSNCQQPLFKIEAWL
jgi:hypothetical protein